MSSGFVHEEEVNIRLLIHSMSWVLTVGRED